MRDIGQYESPCGYCKAASEHKNRGMVAVKLSHKHYQVSARIQLLLANSSRLDCECLGLTNPTSLSLSLLSTQELLDRVWRRCGSLLYRSEPECYKTGCCPLYSIRVDVHRFQMSPKQRKTLRRFRAFLNGEWEPKPKGGADVKMSETKPDRPASSCPVRTTLDTVCHHIWALILLPALTDYCRERGLDLDAVDLSRMEKAVRRANRSIEAEHAKRTKSDPKSAMIFSSSMCFPLAKIWKGVVQDATQLAAELCGRLSAGADAVNRLELGGGGFHVHAIESASGYVNLVARLSSERQAIFAHTCSDEKKPQEQSQTQKKQKKEEARGSAGGGPAKAYSKKTLTIEMMRSEFIKEEFDLFCRYQKSVHKDEENDEDSYSRFLVETPIEYDAHAAPGGVPDSSASPANKEHMPCAVPSFCGHGSFHQQYRINGRLVAVGVVDVMANCLSSKYFFWDPDFAFLELGKISSLAEIDFVAQASATVRSLHYYYQGYYIHTCPKMAYKADYKPAELLCPSTLKWVDFDDALRRKMAASKGRLLSLCLGDEGQAGLFCDEERRSGNLVGSLALSNLVCMLNGKLILLGNLLKLIDPQYRSAVETQASQWMAACGQDTARGMVYKLN